MEPQKWTLAVLAGNLVGGHDHATLSTNIVITATGCPPISAQRQRRADGAHRAVQPPPAGPFPARRRWRSRSSSLLVQRPFERVAVSRYSTTVTLFHGPHYST